MSIDLSFHKGFEGMLRSWLEGRGESMTYMQRFYADFNQKTLGLTTLDYCPRCADINTDNATDPQCFVCFGTGFNGGYAPPLTGDNSTYQRIYAVRKTDTVVTSLQAEGIVTTQQEQMITFLITPEPRYGDLVLDEQGNRYIIGNTVTDWQFNRHHIGWNATVSMLSNDDVLYKVPVPYMVQAIKPVIGNDRMALTISTPYELALSLAS